MIKRVTVTMRPEILRKLDKMIDKASVKNRSHAVEQLILRGMSKTDLDTVVIMAGGDGAKLRPITYEIPKPLIPVRGRPVLEHQINMLKKFDVRNVVIAAGENYGRVSAYFGNGSNFGVSIEYLAENKPLGKMGALALLKGRVKSTFAVLNVDALVNPDIPELYNFHKRQQSIATILLANVKDPKDYGVVRMRGSRVVEFLDKPANAPTNLVDASFYVFEPDVLKFISKGRVMTQDLFRTLAKEGQVSGFVHDGYLFDVATHDGYEKAIKEWKPD